MSPKACRFNLNLFVISRFLKELLIKTAKGLKPHRSFKRKHKVSDLKHTYSMLRLLTH